MFECAASAFTVGEHVTLVFTKVLNEMQRGLVDEDEDPISALTDRAYWGKFRARKVCVRTLQNLDVDSAQLDCLDDD